MHLVFGYVFGDAVGLLKRTEQLNVFARKDFGLIIDQLAPLVYDFDFFQLPSMESQ